jgi:hypothetical protein
MKDAAQLRTALTNDLLREGKGQILDGYKSDPDKEKEFAAVFLDGFVVIGKSESVAVYVAQLRNNEMMKPDHLESLKFSQDDSSVTSFTSERDSTIGVISILSSLGGRTLSDAQLAEIRKRLNNTGVSKTESSLNSSGIERRSHSAFGQFGSLLSLAQADSSSTSIK